MWLVWAGLLTAAALSAAVSPPKPSAHAFLTATLGLRSSDIDRLEAGQAVALTLETAGREVGTLGAIKLGVPPRFYIDRLRDIVEFKRAEAVLQIGVFGSPARLDDLSQLTLEPEDLEDLRLCRPRNCGLQLSADVIERFQRDVPWGTPAATGHANRILRETLFTMVLGYQRRGDEALISYQDAGTPVSVAKEFAALLASPPDVLRPFPELAQHFRQPTAAADRIDDVIYWSKERLGPAVIVSVTHLAILETARTGPVRYVAASKQLYSSHYFDASLGVSFLLEDETTPQPDAYLVYVNRSRLDVLDGFWGALRGPIVRSRVRSAMAETLGQIRTRFATAE